MKLIFESLNDNKISINEGVGELVFPILLGTAWVVSLHLVGKLFDKLITSTNTPKPKTESEAKKVKKDLSKELAVLKAIAKIIESKPKMMYNGDYNIYEYVKMGIVDTPTLRKYISKFKDNITKNSNIELKSILEDGEDEKSYNELNRLKALFIISDGGGNSQWIAPNNKLYDWDHETHELKEIGTYEDFVVKDLEYLYYYLSKDGLLVTGESDNEKK